MNDSCMIKKRNGGTICKYKNVSFYENVVTSFDRNLMYLFCTFSFESRLFEPRITWKI